MRLLEELQMNALPSLQTLLYDGWVLRFANGYTNRANSINPIYQSQENVNEKILRCESIFRSKHLKPTYKITPFVYPGELDELLKKRGYKVTHQTSVQTLHLGNITEPTTKITIVHSASKDEWFEHYCKLNGVSVDDSEIYKKMLNNLIPTRFFTSLLINDEISACGMAVLENDYIGLFDISVSEKYRNNGYGTQLLLSMLKVAKEQGAKKAYLQVMLDNLPALSLYRKLGFMEQYKYFYRVLTD